VFFTLGDYSFDASEYSGETLEFLGGRSKRFTENYEDS
jgi:hypothetical protein